MADEVLKLEMRAKPLYDALNMANSLLGYEPIILFDEKGAHVRNVDNTNVMMLDMNICEMLYFRLSDEISYACVFPEELLKFLKPLCKQNPVVNITVTESESMIQQEKKEKEEKDPKKKEDEKKLIVRTLHVWASLKGLTLHSEFFLQDPMYSRKPFTKPQEMKDLAKFSASAADLRLALKAVNDEDIRISIASSSAALSGKNTHTKAVFECPKSTTPESNTLFSENYLSPALKYAPSKAEVTLENITEWPLHISYMLSEGINVKVVIAPRLEQEQG